MFYYYIGKSFAKRKNFKLAAKFLSKAQRYFKSASDYVILAEALHNIDQPQAAIEVFAPALKKYPSSSYLYERRSHLLREMYREEEAILDLNEAIRLDPRPYLNWYTRALAYKDLGRYEEAIRDFKESIKREDRSTIISTYYELGMAYYQSGNLEEAVQHFKKTIRTPVTVPVYFYMLASSLDRLERTEEAVSYLLEGIKMLDVYESKPDRGYSIFSQTSNYSYGAFKTFQRIIEPTYSFRKDLSDMYTKLEKYDLAVAAITDAIQKHPGNLQLYLWRSNIYMKWGKFLPAHEDIQQAIKLDPQHLGGYFELARLYRLQEEEDKELDVFLHMQDLAPDSPVVYYRIADVCYRLGKFEEALNFNTQLLSIEDDDALNFTQRGEIYLSLERLTEAEEAFDQALVLDNDGDIRYRKSYILYVAGKFTESLEELYQAAQLKASLLQSPSFYIGTGHNYKALQQLDLAVQEYSIAIDLNPENTQYRKYRAECQMDLKQYNPVIEDCIVAIQQSPDSSYFYYLRSGAYFAQGQFNLAKEDVLKWVELEPHSSDGYYYLGRIEYELMNIEQARRLFEKSLSLDIGFYSNFLQLAYVYYESLEFEACEDHLIKWVSYKFRREDREQMVESILALDGFDEDLLQRTVQKLVHTYGDSVHLS